MVLNMELKIIEDNKLEFCYLTSTEAFNNRKGDIIGEAYSKNYAVINSKEEAIAHLEAELAYIDSEIAPVESKLNKLYFDEDKFSKLCEAVVSGGGKTTVAKYKQLNTLVGNYQDKTTLKTNLDYLKAQKEKMEYQLAEVLKLK